MVWFTIEDTICHLTNGSGVFLSFKKDFFFLNFGLFTFHVIKSQEVLTIFSSSN